MDPSIICLVNITVIERLFVTTAGRYGIASVTETQLLEPLGRIDLPGSYRLDELLLALFKGKPDVGHALLDNLAEQRRQICQGRIIGIVEPRLDGNASFGLEEEVFRDVVHDDALVEVASQVAQVLNEYIHALDRVITVQTVIDIVVGCLVLKMC